MARLVFGMNQSLDGYVDHTAFAPGPALFRHFIEEAEGQSGSVYGRRMYEIMRYWDDDHPEWAAEEHAFAAAWRKQPKWVVSRSLKSVGPNATLIDNDVEGTILRLKAEREGDIDVAGPTRGGFISDPITVGEAVGLTGVMSFLYAALAPVLGRRGRDDG